MNPEEASMAMERAWSSRSPGPVEVATPLTPKADTREPSPRFLFSMRQLRPTSESVSSTATYIYPEEASMEMELAWSSSAPELELVATPKSSPSMLLNHRYAGWVITGLASFLAIITFLYGGSWFTVEKVKATECV